MTAALLGALVKTATVATVAAEPAAAPALRISVLGGVRFDYDGREIALRNRKGRALLAYVALSETGLETRERLAGLFWSEFSEHNARTTLRQVVHELREAMLGAGYRGLLSTRTAIGLQPRSFSVDLDEVMEAVGARRIPEALLRETRLSETLLAGCEDLDASFHGWLTARRQTVHDRLIRRLEDGYRDTSLPRLHRRRLAQSALLLDPTHEEACRVVMRSAAEDGEIGVALRAYDELYRLLGDEYDMEPSAPTQALVADVKQGKLDPGPAADLPAFFEAEMRQAQVALHRTAPPPETRPISPKPALFIDKFIMTGIQADQAHLVQGFRSELIACLARFREWYVTGTDGDFAAEHAGVPVSSRYAVTTTAYHAGSPSAS